jgi:hypothetical protein
MRYNSEERGKEKRQKIKETAGVAVSFKKGIGTRD